MSLTPALSKTNQAEVIALANENADKSHGKVKKLLGWTAGLLGAAALLIAFPVAGLGYAGMIAGAVAITTGIVATGHYKAERLMRKAAQEAGNEDFADKLKQNSETLNARMRTADKWGTVGMFAYVATLALPVLFPPAAPAMAVLHSLASGVWGYNAMKSMFTTPSAKSADTLNERAQRLANTDEAQKIFAAANDAGSSLSLAPAPGVAFDKAVNPVVQSDAPQQKPAIQRILSI